MSILSNHIRVRAGAIIIKGDLILLTEYNDPVRGIVYDLPAGGVEPKINYRSSKEGSYGRGIY
ncbi:hypothetical protein ACFSCX_13710 [Bacillus salitolerans]|uniref:Uncharacterized protein n=1 Tax=Bacillus salitolerans TaxID=1437434 RepID=A0ABW4LR89_9BACI